MRPAFLPALRFFILLLVHDCYRRIGSAALSQRPAPIVLTGADRRPATSLDGEWASIVDPYFSGLFSFHHEEKKNGFFLNQKAKPGDTFPIEYDFSKASKLKVPGDWNTQRESLYFYEGPIWFERDFTINPRNILTFFCM